MKGLGLHHVLGLGLDGQVLGPGLEQGSSSSSSNKSDLGGTITLLLQDHRTTNKSVCKQPEHSKQFKL